MAKRKPPRTTGKGRTRSQAKPPRAAAARVTPTGRAPARSTKRRKKVAQHGGITVSEVAELEDLRRELEKTAGRSPLRWNADPDDVQRSVAQLVLTLVEFVRKLLERQAIRRMDAGTLTDEQTEDIGRALMTLEETVVDIARKFGISPDDLNLDLGPVGKLM